MAKRKRDMQLNFIVSADELAVIEQKILEETMLKDSQIIEPVLKPLIDEGQIKKCNNVRKSNFKKDSYSFI